MEHREIKRALLSVSDKTGIKKLGKFLVNAGVEIISTGGTAKALAEDKIPVTPIEKITGNPEAFQGRMKTISFQTISALLFQRGNEKDEAQAQELNIEPIDLLVCNFYPFQSTMDEEENLFIKNIDIGGPTMVRAAAKNFISVLTSPSQYGECMREMEENKSCMGLDSRRKLSAQAFKHTADYEVIIAQEMSKRYSKEKSMWLPFFQGKTLRYGENPHQEAVHYRCPWLGNSSLVSADIIQGKPLSYNNIIDADVAYRAAHDALMANQKTGAAVAVIKHLNPCGLAVAPSGEKALELAWAGDPISAFGSVICSTQEINFHMAQWLKDKFIEVLVAPSIDPEAMKLFTKKKNLRILLCSSPAGEKEKMIRSILGGVLIQDEDLYVEEDFKSVTEARFDATHLAQFGVMAAKHLKSNAIALVEKNKDSMQLVGAGMGQPNRIDSLELLAGFRAKGKNFKEILLASDAFFPFTDIIESAARLGIQRIVQPGGSIRDQEIIEACNQHKIAMAFTGRRHFRH